MLNLYSTVVLPSILPPTRWAGHKEVEKLQVGDTVLFARKGEESFLPGWSLGVVKEVEESSDLEVRIMIIKYAGEIIKKLAQRFL